MQHNATCKGCKRPVRWVKTVSGANMPLDPDPDAGRGNVRIEDTGEARILAKDAALVARGQGTPLYLSHHATCPEVSRFRRQ